MTESNRIEYKRELSDSFEKEYVQWKLASLEKVGKRLRDADPVPAEAGMRRHDRGGASNDFARVDASAILRLSASQNVPKIVAAYSKDVFSFSSRFVRVVLPISEDALKNELLENKYDTGAQSDNEGHVRDVLMLLVHRDLSTAEIRDSLLMDSTTGALKRTLKKLISLQFVAYTIPDKPTSRNQKYRLTKKGRTYLDS